MIFKETKLQGAFIIELEMLTDERGAFARTFCRKDFEIHGLNGNISQFFSYCTICDAFSGTAYNSACTGY